MPWGIGLLAFLASLQWQATKGRAHAAYRVHADTHNKMCMMVFFKCTLLCFFNGKSTHSNRKQFKFLVTFARVLNKKTERD
jgi:hypothetical protein